MFSRLHDGCMRPFHLIRHFVTPSPRGEGLGTADGATPAHDAPGSFRFGVSIWGILCELPDFIILPHPSGGVNNRMGE